MNITRRFVLAGALATAAASAAGCRPAHAASPPKLEPSLRHAYALALGEGAPVRLWSGNGAPAHPLIIAGQRFEEAPFLDFTCEHRRELPLITESYARPGVIELERRAALRFVTAHATASMIATGPAFMFARDATDERWPAHVYAVLFDANAGGRIEASTHILAGRVAGYELTMLGPLYAPHQPRLTLTMHGVAP